MPAQEPPAGQTRKVLLICQTYPPVLGGSEVEAQRVCAALLRRGHQVEVWCADADPMPHRPRWVDPLGVPVRILGIGWRGRPLNLIYALQVSWLLWRERKQYEIAYFLMQGLHLATGLFVARWLRKPVVVKISGSTVITGMQESWLGRFELRYMRDWAKRLMILNPGMAEEAYQAGFEPDHLVWMPNPVDIDRFCPASETDRQKWRHEENILGPTVIYVGRLAPEKELDSLISAFASAAAHHPQATLILLGEGPCRAALEDQVRSLGLTGHVRFEGRVPAEVVHHWLQTVDIFALVSSGEGFPCALSEAMAVGLPSVVSDIPGIRQLIDPEVHGLAAPVRDEVALSAALGRLLADADLRARMGLAARQRIVDNYSTEKVIHRYETLFEDVLR